MSNYIKLLILIAVFMDCRASPHPKIDIKIEIDPNDASSKDGGTKIDFEIVNGKLNNPTVDESKYKIKYDTNLNETNEFHPDNIEFGHRRNEEKEPRCSLETRWVNINAATIGMNGQSRDEWIASNHKPGSKELFEVEICSEDNEICHTDDDGNIYRCQQFYTYRNLPRNDYTNEIPDSRMFPSCCKCVKILE